MALFRLVLAPPIFFAAFTPAESGSTLKCILGFLEKGINKIYVFLF